MSVGGRRDRRRRLGWWLVLLTLAALALAGATGWWVLKGTVPQLTGEMRLAGLRAPVEVLFDRWGIPHIYARDPEDAWAALGYLHGRERFWQMELYRRATGGRLSELFGESTLNADKRLLALGLRRAANAEWQTASPVVRAALERYAAGVNQAAAEVAGRRRPVELLILGQELEPWTPVDSLSVARLLAWRLSENRHGELVRGRLARKFGPAVANRLMGDPPGAAPTIVDSDARRASDQRTYVLPVLQFPLARQAEEDRLPAALAWLGITARPGASNSWVIAGSRTESGKPLLANDPHLNVEMPSLWYEAHLVAAGLDVAGATLPSAPFVIIGHNARIAWGLTNSGVDVQDFFVEDVDMSRRRYLFRGRWEPLAVDRYEIGVRGRSRPEVFELYSTRHGPLVATETAWEEVPDLSAEKGRVSPRPLALTWDAASRGETAGAFEALNRARDWASFLDAVRRLAAPSQNVVYADVDGNIGYALSGRLPLRTAGDGGTPVPGWTGEYEWIGTVPPERLPAVLNPPSGQIVAANGEIDRSWPGTMTRDWTAYFRTERIRELLGSRTGLNREAMTVIQLDVRANAGEGVLGALEAAARSPAFKRAEPQARVVAERLRLWDREVDERPVVALYEAYKRALWQRTFADEMEAGLFKEFVEYGLGERYAGLYAIIDDPRSEWWDDIATLDRRETRDDIVLLAAADAALTLESRFGDEAKWRWDRLHATRFGHAMGAGGFLLDWFFSRGPVPTIGDSWTVRKSTVDVRAPYNAVEVASYRQVVDLADLDATLAINTTGQSGHPMSPHYFDQNALWAQGRYRPFPVSRAVVDREKHDRLLMTP